MVLTKRITRLKQFIEDKLGEGSDKSSLEYRSWKYELNVRNLDTYHNIAQAFNIKELIDANHKISYKLRVPDPPSMPELWTVRLSDNLNQEFLTKYGHNYKIEQRR